MHFLLQVPFRIKSRVLRNFKNMKRLLRRVVERGDFGVGEGAVVDADFVDGSFIVCCIEISRYFPHNHIEGIKKHGISNIRASFEISVQIRVLNLVCRKRGNQKIVSRFGKIRI
jgi:hypothetical protein